MYIMITGAMKTNPTKVLKMLLELPTLRTVLESAALMAAYRLLKLDPKNLGIGPNQIWVKADIVDNRINMIEDLRHTSGKYRLVKRTREEWEKNWLYQLREGPVWFTAGVCNQQGTGAGIYKYQSKRQWHIFSVQDATAFQTEVAAILDCVTSCPRKRQVKEQMHW